MLHTLQQHTVHCSGCFRGITSPNDVRIHKEAARARNWENAIFRDHDGVSERGTSVASSRRTRRTAVFQSSVSRHYHASCHIRLRFYYLSLRESEHRETGPARRRA